MVWAALCHRWCHHNRFIHLVPANSKLVSSSAAATCPSQLSSGKMLEGESDLIFCIAVEFYDRDNLRQLANELLEGVTIGNRKYYLFSAYFERKAREIGTRDCTLIAREVMQDWIRERPREATKTNLYKVIVKIIPLGGSDFESVLTSKLELKDKLTIQLYLSCEKEGPSALTFFKVQSFFNWSQLFEQFEKKTASKFLVNNL